MVNLMTVGQLKKILDDFEDWAEVRILHRSMYAPPVVEVQDNGISVYLLTELAIEDQRNRSLMRHVHVNGKSVLKAENKKEVPNA